MPETIFFPCFQFVQAVHLAAIFEELTTTFACVFSLSVTFRMSGI